MQGLLIEKFAGCILLQDSYADEHIYRVMTHNNICIVETRNIVNAYKAAECFSKLFFECPLTALSRCCETLESEK